MVSIKSHVIITVKLLCWKIIKTRQNILPIIIKLCICVFCYEREVIHWKALKMHHKASLLAQDTFTQILINLDLVFGTVFAICHLSISHCALCKRFDTYESITPKFQGNIFLLIPVLWPWALCWVTKRWYRAQKYK